MFTLESSSLLQLLNSGSNGPEKVGRDSPVSIYQQLAGVIRREGLDRVDGDFLEIGGATQPLANLARAIGKRVWCIQQEPRKGALPHRTRLAFAFVDENHDPVRVKNDFRLVWDHLIAGGWAAFGNYAGDSVEVTNALNGMLTECSAEIDRVERIKDQRVLLIRKRTARAHLGKS